MPESPSFIAMLNRSGLHWQAFETGRIVSPLEDSCFTEFEQGKIPYPYPLQQQAWVALTFSDKQHRDTPNVWFLKLPLDETGHLALSARDYLLESILKAMISSSKNGNDSENALSDNPFAFQPRQEKMATFNARFASSHGKPASKHYDHARSYFSGELGWDQWSFVAFQGIADIAARLHQDGNTALLSGALSKLPEEPLHALALCLENEILPDRLVERFSERYFVEQQLATPSVNILTACTRAVSRSSGGSRDAFYRQLLDTEALLSVEMLVALAAKAWDFLARPEITSRYLEQLAQQEQQFFNLCLSDLMFLPGMRPHVLAALRQPERSDRLAQAFQTLIKGTATDTK